MTAVAKKKFNPKFGNGFTNDKFGEGSIIINIDAEGLAALTQNVRVGSALLLKYNKVTSAGNKHYFGEILPPFDGNKKPVKAATTELD